MKFSDLKSLIQQGKLIEFQSSLSNSEFVPADYNLLLRQLIKNKSKKITPIFNQLLKKGADVNFAHIGLNQKSNLMVASQEGTIQVIQLLLAHPKIDCDLQDSMKKTAPFYAIENKNKNDSEIFLDKLLKHAPHLVNKPANNQTMLILAIKKQKPDLVKILLNHRAQPNYVIGDSGNTALHEAIKMCKNKQTKANKDIVKLLIQFGADPLIKNKKDKNVFQFADKFPLQNLISQVQIKPRIQKQKEIQAEKQNNSTNKKNNNSSKQDRNVSSNQNKTNSVRGNQQAPSSQNWRISPIHKQKSKKQINNNKDYQSRQTKDFTEQTQNRQNRQNIQTNDNYKKLFSINTEQDINDLIHRADVMYDNDKLRMQQVTLFDKKKNDHLLSQDQDQQQSDLSDSQSEQGQTSQQTMYKSYQKKQQFISSLSQQIFQYERKCEQYFHHAQKQFQKFYHKLRQMAYNQNLDIQLYGSFSTGLWYKNCDIDILLVPRDQLIGQKNPNYIENILDRFEMLLKKQESIKINNFMKNKKIRVPMIRIDVQFPYNSIKTRKIDITVFDRNHNGPAIAHYICQNMKLSPQLKPLFFVIKALTYFFKLNDPKNGGIRTYAIVIMILSFLQNQRIKGTNLEDIQIGQLLLRFLYFFGFEYQYGYGFEVGNDMKQQLPGARMEPSLLLTIYDPLNHSNNLGKNAKAYQLQSMFKSAFIGLHANIKQQKLQFMFGLRRICMF